MLPFATTIRAARTLSVVNPYARERYLRPALQISHHNRTTGSSASELRLYAESQQFDLQMARHNHHPMPP